MITMPGEKTNRPASCGHYNLSRRRKSIVNDPKYV